MPIIEGTKVRRVILLRSAGIWMLQTFPLSSSAFQFMIPFSSTLVLLVAPLILVGLFVVGPMKSNLVLVIDIVAPQSISISKVSESNEFVGFLGSEVLLSWVIV